MKVRIIIRLIVIDDDMSRAEKIQSIRNILRNATVNKSLVHYPMEAYILAIRILAIQMRDQKAVSVYYLMKIREFAKHNKIFVCILRKIGIGK